MVATKRKEDESIVCELSNGDEVQVEIARLKDNQIRITIGAPYNAIIIRKL